MPRLSCGEAAAQRSIQIGAAKRTATVSVYIGKSEDVRTDTSFVEITVGDPEVADVNPLTDRALSILGKKNGTTRVSAYAEGKKLIGVFDVEVVYDTSLLQTEIQRRFPYARLKVTAVNGRIMLSGTAPDGPTVDKAVVIAKQFGPDVINIGQGAAPQQVMLEVRFVEANRTGRPRARRAVERVRPAQHLQHRQPHAGRPASGRRRPAPACSSPSTDPAQSRRTQRRGLGVTISPIVVAGVLSGTAPFGVIVQQDDHGRPSTST